VLEIAGRPIQAIKADTLNDSHVLLSEKWFLDEMQTYRSEGVPIWDGRTALTVRPSLPDEEAELWAAEATELARSERNNYVFAFFIPIDPALQ
jgi:hypothetical protein